MYHYVGCITIGGVAGVLPSRDITTPSPYRRLRDAEASLSVHSAI